MADVISELEATVTACLWCGKPIRQKATGRPRAYCIDNNNRCKEAARRKRDRDRDRAAIARVTVGAEVPDQNLPGADDVSCRVCGAAPATVGPKGNPILCEGCARA